MKKNSSNLKIKGCILLCLAFFVILLFGYLKQPKPSEDKIFSLSISSKNNDIAIMPTRWLSSSELQLTLENLLLTDYMADNTPLIQIDVLKRNPLYRETDTYSGSKACGMKRFNVETYDDGSIQDIIDHINAPDWATCSPPLRSF